MLARGASAMLPIESRLRSSTNPSAVSFSVRLAVAVATSCLAILACVDANAQVEIPASVGAYASAITELLKERGKRPIEPVFEGGMQAAPELQSGPAGSQRIAVSTSSTPNAGLHRGAAGAGGRASERRLLQKSRAQAGQQSGPRFFRHLPAYRTGQTTARSRRTSSRRTARQDARASTTES